MTRAAREVAATAIHECTKSSDIARTDHGAQPFDRVEQGSDRLRAVVVEQLDLEVEIGILARDVRGHSELRIERGRR